jgi:hypothetical protein
MKYFITFLAAIYFGIELQSWLFLSDLYTKPLNAEILGKYERFGYASVGLGVSLLYLRQSVKLTNRITMVVAFAFVPLVYIASVWGVYEVIQKSANWVDDKPKAMKASLLTLAEPSLANLTAYYFGDPETSIDTVNSFMRAYPASDKLIQSSYIKGLRRVNAFSDVYEKGREQLDKKAVRGLISKGMIYTLDINSTRTANQHLNVLAAKNALIEKYGFWVSPLLISQYEEFSSGARDDIAQAKSYYSKHFDSISFHSPKIRASHSSISGFYVKIDYLNWNIPAYDFTDIVGKQKSQAMIADSFGVENTTYQNVDDLTYFQQMVSKATLQPILGNEQLGDFPLIPWDGKSDFSNEDAYLYAVKRIAPFFFSGNSPIINLRGIRDEERRGRYISNMRAGLSSGLKSHWLTYQKETYLLLSEEQSAWDNPANKALNKDMIRVGAILPVMFLLSTVMLIANVVISTIDNKINGIAIIAAGAIVVTFQSTALTDAMFAILLPISVKAPQIFVF